MNDKEKQTAESVLSDQDLFHSIGVEPIAWEELDELIANVENDIRKRERTDGVAKLRAIRALHPSPLRHYGDVVTLTAFKSFPEYQQPNGCVDVDLERDVRPGSVVCISSKLPTGQDSYQFALVERIVQTGGVHVRFSPTLRGRITAANLAAGWMIHGVVTNPTAVTCLSTIERATR